MNKSNVRWALVTFALGLSSGIMGHCLPPELAYFGVVLLSGGFAFLGWAAMESAKD